MQKRREVGSDLYRVYEATGRARDPTTGNRWIELGSGGMSLPIIGKLLGHTQVQTTQHYAHLFDDPLRAGLNEIGDMLRPKLRIVGPGFASLTRKTA